MATKCPYCGANNREGIRTCWSCEKALPDPQTRDAASRARSADVAEVNYRTIPSKMKLDYQHGVTDPTQRCLDSLQSLLFHAVQPEMKLDDLLQESVNAIHRLLGIDSVTVGLRDSRDGFYRYKAMAGFREDAIDGLKEIAYKKEQFFENPQFLGTDISKLSRLYLTEDNISTNEEEQKTFNRPALLVMKRRTASDSLEGDYIDTKILGPSGELLGWIECSGTRTMKLPDAAAIRWIEVIASVIAIALVATS